MREDSRSWSLVFKAKAEWETGLSHTSQQAEDAKPKQGQYKNQPTGAQSRLKLPAVDEEERKLETHLHLEGQSSLWWLPMKVRALPCPQISCCLWYLRGRILYFISLSASPHKPF